MQKILRTTALAASAFVLLTTIPAQSAEPFGTTACTGIRPGAWMEAPRGTVYTMGFLFKGTDAKRKTSYYISTVGNYVFPSFGKKIWSGKTGPQAYDAAGKPIGRFVYAVNTDTPSYTSFGLLRLDTKIKPKAQVCHFGGPTGLYTGIDPVPATVEYYGNGFPVDAVSPARTAVITGTNEENAYAQALVSLIDTGDNGAPFLADGKALGYWDGGVGGGSGGAGIVVARIGPWISKAQKALKIKFALQTAKPL